MRAQLLGMLLGVWLMAAPDILGYDGAAALNDHILGPVIATLAAVAAWEATRPLRWGNLPIGLWLIVAPWLLGYETVPLLNSTAVGLLLVATCTVRGRIRQRFGGGWSALGGPGDPELRSSGAEERADGRASDGRPPRPEVVVVTGASAGVGRATVRAFARRGASIGLIARGVAGLEAARREVEEAGGKALVLPLDVADARAVEEAAAKVEEELGPIDIWINNAMLSVFSPAEEMTPEEYRRVTEVTYLGYVHGTLAALKRMRPRDRGVVVQVGSALAYRGIPLQSAYCAAKHAVEGFHDSLRCELIHDGSNVRLTMVQMPALNTPQFRWVKSRLPNKAQPVPPIYQPELAAAAIVWAAEHDRRELLVGWPTVKAVWGNTFFPAYADWKLARMGYEAQQIPGEPSDPESPNNLWEPVDRDEDRGAHGVFDDRATDSSLQFWLTTHRGLVSRTAAVVAATACAVALLILRL